MGVRAKQDIDSVGKEDVYASAARRTGLDSCLEATLQAASKRAFVRLPLESAEAEAEIKSVLANESLPVALLWQDWHESQGEGVIPWENLNPLLNGLGNLQPHETDAILKRSRLVVQLIKACNNVPNLWPETLNRLPLFAACQVDGNIISVSLKSLLAANENNLIFVDGREWLSPLIQAAPQIRPLVIERSLAEALRLNLHTCDVLMCIRLLYKASRVAALFSDRKDLFEKLLAQTYYSEGHIKALRCLLHGRRDKWEDNSSLLVEPSQIDAFAQLAKLALETVQQSWRLIAHDIIGQIALNDLHRKSLILTEVSVKTIESLIFEIGPEQLDCANIDECQCSSILNNFSNPELLKT
ncbi:hypothetical protein NXS98_07240 [Fontisphaera persica]|uniref:hypothetical protein n=1 Tax=Fontisphaera persica TaxID=2974023 RepID=UPI0024C059B5|nr:hypothetical protein [Fontisphaera persica]WCJ60907.1 hypothetical protein NXS98_07240 [Fontisphaera persica]